MARPSGQGLRLLILLPGVLSLMIAGAGGASGPQPGYRFAPTQQNAAGGGAWAPQGGGIQDPAMTLGPGGRAYKFRDLDEPQPQQGLVFRPDSSLNQLPKNWGRQGNWASDPVLQQGMIFRPLGKDNAEQESSPPPSIQPPYPSPYPYYYPWSGMGGYPLMPPPAPYYGGEALN